LIPTQVDIHVHLLKPAHRHAKGGFGQSIMVDLKIHPAGM